jgi:methylthioribose-1-phosphate isomerase
VTLNLDKLPRTLWWQYDEDAGLAGVYLVDQTRLPLQGDILACRTLEGVEIAIKSLALRGAPALGVGAAMALALWSENQSRHTAVEEYLAALDSAAEKIAAARPTAVNLAWGAERVRGFAQGYVAANAEQPDLLVNLKAAIVELAQQMAAEDEASNRALGAAGAPLLAEGSRVLTHCNAGSLGTAYYGTALGVVYTGFDQGKVSHVWVSETRPLNQGARLTAWELGVVGIPNTLITDSMVASVMAHGWVDAVLVGADRIAANGDTANKIGTLGVAHLAKTYGVPFYVCAPTTTIDPSLSDGSLIPIEQRDPREIEGFNGSGVILPDTEEAVRAFDSLTSQGERELKLKNGHQMLLSRKGGAYGFDAWFKTTPQGVTVYNPAFDVTAARLITAIITDKGVFYPGEGGSFDLRF